jgi:hypothetical protein
MKRRLNTPSPDIVVAHMAGSTARVIRFKREAR